MCQKSSKPQENFYLPRPIRSTICQENQRHANTGRPIFQVPKTSLWKWGQGQNVSCDTYLSAEPDEIISPSGDQEHLIKFYIPRDKN